HSTTKESATFFKTDNGIVSIIFVMSPIVI
ncbi:MAG: hypothetical protein ACI97A_004267, partial [Planctomycetota bacterium]